MSKSTGKTGVIFSKWYWENWISMCRKMKIDPLFWIKPMKNASTTWSSRTEEEDSVRCRHRQGLQRSTGLWEHRTSAQELILGIVCNLKLHSEENIQKIEETVTEWEQMKTVHLMGLIPRVCKELRKLNKMNNTANKWTNELDNKSQTILSGNMWEKCCL